MDRFASPVGLLRRDISGGWDARFRVDEKQGNDLAMTGFSGVDEPERGDLMLINVRERDASIDRRPDGTHDLVARPPSLTQTKTQ